MGETKDTSELPVRASTITERESIEISYRLWDFLANNPGKKKDDWPEYESTGLANMQSRCPLCDRRTAVYTRYNDETERYYESRETVCEGLDAIDKESLLAVVIESCPLDGGPSSAYCADGVFELYAQLMFALGNHRMMNDVSLDDTMRKLCKLTYERVIERLVAYSYANLAMSPEHDITTEEGILAELAMAARVIADWIKGALDTLTKEESNG